LWFSYEKVFTVVTPAERQNVFFCCQKNRFQREHSSRVSCCVKGWQNESVVFVNPSANVDSNYYCTRVLGQDLLPDIMAKCGLYKWTLQQDGAPSHTAQNTITYLRGENVTFTEPDMWPPNSPDLNPVDYAIWGSLQERVNKGRKFNTVDQLKQAIVLECRALPQRFIDHSISEWRRRLVYSASWIRMADTLHTRFINYYCTVKSSQT